MYAPPSLDVVRCLSFSLDVVVKKKKEKKRKGLLCAVSSTTKIPRSGVSELGLFSLVLLSLPCRQEFLFPPWWW